MFRIIFCLFILFYASASHAAMQPGKAEVVTEIVRIARANLTNAVMSDGSPVPPETDEEKLHPIIPMMDAVRVVDRGNLSAMAEWCNMEWEHASYLPFMQKERKEARWSDKQLAFIGLIHGVTMQATKQALAKQKPCTSQQAGEVKARLAKKLR